MAVGHFLLPKTLGNAARISKKVVRPSGYASPVWSRTSVFEIRQDRNMPAQPVIKLNKKRISYRWRNDGIASGFQPGIQPAQRYSSTASSPQRDGNAIASPLPDLELPDNIPLSHYMMNEFQQYGDSVAMVNSVTAEEITFAQLQTMIARVTNSLIKLGFGRGDVATLCATNSPEFVIIYLAVVSAGGVISAVSPAYTAGELKKAIDQSQSSVLIVSEEILSIARPCLKQCPSVKRAIVLGSAEGFQPFSSLLEGDLTPLPDLYDLRPRDDTVALPFSSGTTGLPKGVMLTHYNLISNTLQTRGVMKYVAGHSVLLAVLPFFHIYGQVVVALAGLAAGAKIVTIPKFEPVNYLSTLQKYSATFLHIVPPIALFLAKHPMVSDYRFSSVEYMFTGAAPCGADTINDVRNRLGKNIIIKQGYGLTEASPLTNCNLDSDNKFNTIGPGVANTLMKIVDVETRKPVEFGQSGELLIKGPQVMKGYFNNVKATNETLVDDWLLTGDIGYFEEGGHVVIADRLKELIKVKGCQVAPAELEALLVTHEAVLDAAVIGKPDERLGEAPIAFVVLNSKYKPSETINKQLQDFVAERVAPTKRLAGGIRFVDQIPKSASGKILRRELKSQLS